MTERIYRVWNSMRQRCENPHTVSFPNYGGRGIFVCERWRSFRAFKEDMGERPEEGTLERRDNDGPYSPENCFWATRHEQARNRRNNVLIEFAGKRMVAEDWAAELDIPARTLCRRIRKGIDPVTAIAMGRGRCRRGYARPPQSVARIQTCCRGHEMGGDNVFIRSDGQRGCRACRIQNQRRWRSRMKGDNQ